MVKPALRRLIEIKSGRLSTWINWKHCSNFHVETVSEVDKSRLCWFGIKSGETKVAQAESFPPQRRTSQTRFPWIEIWTLLGTDWSNKNVLHKTEVCRTPWGTALVKRPRYRRRWTQWSWLPERKVTSVDPCRLEPFRTSALPKTSAVWHRVSRLMREAPRPRTCLGAARTWHPRAL